MIWCKDYAKYDLLALPRCWVLLQLPLYFTRSAQKLIRLERKMGVWCTKEEGRTSHERKERSPPPIFLLLIGSVKSVPCGSEEDVLIREDFLRAFCLNTVFFSFLDLYLPFVSGSHHCLNNFHIPCPFNCFSYIRCIQWSSCTVITHDIECTEEKPNFERETWNFQLKGWSWNIFPS